MHVSTFSRRIGATYEAHTARKTHMQTRYRTSPSPRASFAVGPTPFPSSRRSLILRAHLLEPRCTLEETPVNSCRNRERTTDNGAQACNKAKERLALLLAVDNFHRRDVLLIETLSVIVPSKSRPCEVCRPKLTYEKNTPGIPPFE